jgi:hypothetical protein
MGKDYLKIKQRYGLFLSKLLQTHNSLKITRLIQFWQPRGVAELWDGMKKKRGYEVFIGEDCYQLSEKQWTFVNPSVHPILFVQLSKGCIIRLGIIERVFQKVAYVHVVPRMAVYYLQSIHTVVPPRTSAEHRVRQH